MADRHQGGGREGGVSPLTLGWFKSQPPLDPIQEEFRDAILRVAANRRALLRREIDASPYFSPIVQKYSEAEFLSMLNKHARVERWGDGGGNHEGAFLYPEVLRKFSWRFWFQDRIIVGFDCDAEWRRTSFFATFGQFGGLLK